MVVPEQNNADDTARERESDKKEDNGQEVVQEINSTTQAKNAVDSTIPSNSENSTPVSMPVDIGQAEKELLKAKNKRYNLETLPKRKASAEKELESARRNIEEANKQLIIAQAEESQYQSMLGELNTRDGWNYVGQTSTKNNRGIRESQLDQWRMSAQQAADQLETIRNEEIGYQEKIKKAQDEVNDMERILEAARNAQ